MPIELSILHQLIAHQRTAVQIGDMPEAAAKSFGCHPGIIFLGSREAKKLLEKHTLTLAAIQNIPFGMRDGRWFWDNRRDDCAVLVYASREDGQLYYASVKKVGPGHELWLQTCHRTTLAKAARRIKKLRPLK